MPVLANSRHEAFCLNIAKGMNQVEAYIGAGYPESSSNASAASSLHARSSIQARIVELREEMVNAIGITDAPTPIDGIDREWLVKQLVEGIEGAKKARQFGHAFKAIALLAELCGYTKPQAPAAPPGGTRPGIPGLPTSPLQGVPVFDPSKLASVIEAAKGAPAEADDDDEDGEE